MIINPSLDRFLLGRCLSDAGSHRLVVEIERLSAPENKDTTMPEFMNKFGFMNNFKSVHSYYLASTDGQVYIGNDTLLAFFTIPFIYDFFKSIKETLSKPITFEVIFKIFAEAFDNFVKETSDKELQRLMPNLTIDEIKFFSTIASYTVEKKFSPISGAMINAII